MDLIIENDCILGIIPAAGYIGLEISEYIILFNMCTGSFHQKDPLTEITVYIVLDDGNCGALYGLDAGSPIVGDHLVLFDAGVVLFAGAEDAVFLVALDFVELDDAVTTEEILGDCNNAVFVILTDLIHYYEGVAR